MEEKKESFHYTYSAKQQEEIQSIHALNLLLLFG